MSSRFDLISKNNSQIIQGETWQLSLIYPENVSGCTIKGQIRRDFAQNEGEILAEFGYLPLVYDQYQDCTTITLTLTAEQTALIPYTKYQGQEGVEPSKRNCFLYDVELIRPTGEKEKLISLSYVEVKPEITR